MQKNIYFQSMNRNASEKSLPWVMSQHRGGKQQVAAAQQDLLRCLGQRAAARRGAAGVDADEARWKRGEGRSSHAGAGLVINKKQLLIRAASG